MSDRGGAKAPTPCHPIGAGGIICYEAGSLPPTIAVAQLGEIEYWAFSGALEPDGAGQRHLAQIRLFHPRLPSKLASRLFGPTL